MELATFSQSMAALNSISGPTDATRLTSDNTFQLYRSIADQSTTPAATNNNDSPDKKLRIGFEDITQETDFSGDVSDVYRTLGSQWQRRKAESRFTDLSLDLRRSIPARTSLKDEKAWVRLEIQSPTLREAFRRIASGIVTIDLHQDPIKIPEPYVELYYCESRIQTAIDEASDNDLKQELQLLRTFQTSYMSKDLKRFHDLEPYGQITCDLFPSILLSGSLVLIANRVASDTGIFWAAILEKCEMVTVEKAKYWQLILRTQGVAVPSSAQLPQRSFNLYSMELEKL